MVEKEGTVDPEEGKEEEGENYENGSENEGSEGESHTADKG